MWKFKEQIVDELDELELQMQWDPHLAQVVKEGREETKDRFDTIVDERCFVLWEE